MNLFIIATHKIIKDQMSENSRASSKQEAKSLAQLYAEVAQPTGQLFHSQFTDRAWLKNHGKYDYILFSDKALVELRKYFNSLDEKKTGSIGVQQLEDPFIAFGLSENREQVEELVKAVDLDGSGEIQFDQFLEIMVKIKRGQSSNPKNSAMFDFFQRMSTGRLGEDFDKDMSFKLNVSQYRRKKLLQSIMSNEKDKKQKGAKILQNFKKQVTNNPQLCQTLNQSKKATSSMYGIDFKAKKRGK